MGWFFSSLIILLFLISLLKKSNNIFYVLPVFYALICVYTSLGVSFFVYAKEVPFNFYYKLDENSINVMYTFYYTAIFSFLLGVISIRNDLSSIKFSFSRIRLKISDIGDGYKFGFVVFTIFVLHLGNGFSSLYSRVGYTIEDGSGMGSFRIIFIFLLPFAVFLLSFLKSKALRYASLFLLFMFLQGTTSRSLILVPVFYMLGASLRSNKVSYLKILLTIIFVIFIVIFTLQYRENLTQGVFPNILFFANNGLDMEYLSLGLNYILSYSFFASTLTIQDFDFNLASFKSSINPLPSSFIDVESMVESQSLNQYAPFPAIGTLSQGGYWYVVCYYYISGVIWSWFGGYLSRASNVFSVFMGVFFILFTLFSVQYNLRGVTRYLYYLIFISLLVKCFSVARFNFNKYLS